MATATQDHALKHFGRVTHLRLVADRLQEALRETRRRVDGAAELTSILLAPSVRLEIDDAELEKALKRLGNFDAALIVLELEAAEEAASAIVNRLDAEEMAAHRRAKDA